jgi:hypothetical protein
MVSSMKCPWLYDGVTMLTRGDRTPGGLTSGVLMPSSVHGQPALPGGGEGSSTNVGHRTLTGRHGPLRRRRRYEFVVPAQVVVRLTDDVEPAACRFGPPVPDSPPQVDIAQQFRDSLS